MNFSKWAREPLVHFAALGALLYMALTWGGSTPDPSSRLINVGAAEKESIAQSWAMTMGRAPTDAELDQAIDTYVREEVLYREALRLGLDEGDTVVRRRLVSKMDLSASLAAETAEPSDDTLRAFVEENREDYTTQAAANARVTFEQRLFASEASARTALASGAGGGKATALPSNVSQQSLRDVEARFGQQFAAELDALEPADGWQGPVASGFGWHLVRLTERTLPIPDFEELREIVANDWRSAQIKTRKERAYETLRSAYRIEIEP